MDEVRDDTGIIMNDSNPYDGVLKSYRKIRVIIERFRIAYYRFPYKKLPRIMIRHLVMNVTRNLNLFATKGGVMAQYIPDINISQINWDCNKHYQD